MIEMQRSLLFRFIPGTMVWYGMVWGTRDSDPLGGLVLLSRESFLRYHYRRPRARQPAGHTEVG